MSTNNRHAKMIIANNSSHHNRNHNQKLPQTSDHFNKLNIIIGIMMVGISGILANNLINHQKKH